MMAVLMLCNLDLKPYSNYRYFIREYHFHFLSLGISGWGMGVFLWGYSSVEFRLGFFYAGLGVGLLVVASCGSWVGSFGGLRVEA